MAEQVDNNAEDKITDKVEDQVDTKEPEKAEAPKPEDDDPMIVDMREAEAEIAKEEAEAKVEGKEGEEKVADKAAETEPNTPEAEKPKTDDVKDDPAKAAEANAEETKMVPLARLNQVLSEKDRVTQALNYTQGILDTQSRMLEGKTGEQVDGKAAPLDAKTHEEIIAKAEADKIELAQKYEDGDISFKEVQEQVIELDRGIRKQDDLRREQDNAKFQEMVEGAAKIAENVSANNVETTIRREAIEIQERHPYVAEIDKLDPDNKKEAWAMIGNEAARLLAAKGIDPFDGTVESRRVYVLEKAALTDKYGPVLVGKAIEVNKDSLDQPKAGELTDTQKERAAKLELSQQQPPEVSGTVTDKRQDLTETDVENMDLDQVADMLMTAPLIIQKAAGMKNL